MAGGMILLGVLLNYFDVASGMILFSIIQLFANGWRGVQWRGYVLWPVFGWYVAGGALSVAGMVVIGLGSGQGTPLPAPGFSPVSGAAPPAALRPHIAVRRGAIVPRDRRTTSA